MRTRFINSILKLLKLINFFGNPELSDDPFIQTFSNMPVI
jgi:hypothetical protein